MSEKFEVVREYEKNISLKELLGIQPTEHMRQFRQERYDAAVKCLDENDYVEKIFVVDRGHFDGDEIHCITHSGIVFILNRLKYECSSLMCLITILIARPHQLERYGYPVSEYTRNKALSHREQGLNII